METIQGYDNWKLASPDYEDEARICECGEEIYDDEATDCEDCIHHICEECGEYSEDVVVVAPTETYCENCYKDFE